MPRFIDGLPALYQPLFPSFLQSEIPVESKATCSNCAMCEGTASGVVPSVDGVSRLFRPDTKCCTYHPRLPNYLVGGMLSDPRPELAEGRRRLEEKIARRVGTNPQWLKAPARYHFLYTHSRQFFGRTASLRCPYYEPTQGACTIWPYREAVCSTYFCKYVAGADGRKMWMALKSWLTLVEIQLSRHALLELMPDYVLEAKDRADAASADRPLTAEELDEQPPSEATYSELWGQWKGREAELYRACYERVCALTPEQFNQVLGLDGSIELQVLERAWKGATTAALPRVLKLNPSATVQWLPDGSVAMASYSDYDAVALPGEAYALLTEFTGTQPVEAVRQRLRETKQADLHEDLLLELYRHRILVEGPAAPLPGRE